VRTIAQDGAEPLRDALAAHEAWLGGERLAARRRRGLEARLRTLVAGMLAERLLHGAGERLRAEAAEVAAGRWSILHAAERAVEALLP
jgi:hypothetical protein